MSDYTGPVSGVPGWHQDDTGHMRWWDGAAWGQYQDVPPPQPAPPVPGYPSAPPPGGQYPGAPAGYAAFGGPPPPKKSALPLVLAIVGIFVVLLLGGGVAAALLLAGSSEDSPSDDKSTSATVSDKEMVEQDYADYTEAWRTGDCDGYESTTTADLRDSESEYASYSCSDFDGLEARGTSMKYEVVDVTVDGDTATMTVDESYTYDDGYQETLTYDYELVKRDGDWLVSWSDWY